MFMFSVLQFLNIFVPRHSVCYYEILLIEVPVKMFEYNPCKHMLIVVRHFAQVVKVAFPKSTNVRTTPSFAVVHGRGRELDAALRYFWR